SDLKIDKDDLVGFVEHGIRHCLAHPDFGDFLHDVVQAFEVLNVKRGPEVDSCCEQFVNILPPLGMAATRHIGVGILVNKQQARPSLERRVEIELMHDLVAVDDRLSSSCSVSRRPCVSTRPATTSRPSALSLRAEASMA